MPIRFRCQNCEQLLSIATRKAGGVVRCPACKADIHVPRLEDVEPKAEVSATAPSATAEAVAPTPAEGDDEDAFALRAPETEFEEMDLTPMVDVTFLLLIFFMITASFSLQKTIQVPAPDPNEEGAAQSMTIEELETDSIIVEIDENNAIVIDDDPLTDPSALINTLADKMRSDHKSELLLDAHRRALHETVVLVIDAANDVGMQKIRLATHGAD